MKWESRQLKRSRWRKWFAWKPITIEGINYWCEIVYRRRRGDCWQHTTFEALMQATNNPKILDGLGSFDLVPAPPPVINQFRYNPGWDRIEVYTGTDWISADPDSRW